jgi:hypothetical protein
MNDTPINANFIYLAVVSLFDSHWDYEVTSQDLRGDALQDSFARLSKTQSMGSSE